MTNPTLYTPLQFPFPFLFLFLLHSCVQCHEEPTKHIPTSPHEFKTKLQRAMLSILLGSITGLACALVCACFLRFIFRCMNKVPILKGPVVFSPQIPPKSLQSALANESYETLVPISGKYYKTTLDNGFTVAVKKLEPGPTESSAKRRMQRELELLAGLRHRHVMSLRAYVGEPDRFCLVYDYVPTGTLEDAMRKRRENELQIGWDARLRIAVGIIKGLQYLHFSCSPRILHYDLKPSNVLLDADFEPRLGDCGLAKVMNTFDGIRSSEGYYAPEYFPNLSMYTEKSDIFSFGVILGILLTGREPSDPLFEEVTSGSRSRSTGGMGTWFRQLVEAGDGREALDKSLLGEEMEEDEMLMAVRIAAVCLSDMPADRPSSDELVPMLTQLHSF